VHVHLNISTRERPIPEFLFGIEQRSRHQTNEVTRETTPQLLIGSNKCLCSGCGQFFGGVRAFEIHRVMVGSTRDRACLGLGSMAERGLRLNAKGYWVQEYSTKLSWLKRSCDG